MFRLSLLVIFISIPNIAYAYLGLGALVPLLGNVIMFIIIGVLTIFGFFSYPIKKFLEKIKKKREKDKIQNENLKI